MDPFVLTRRTVEVATRAAHGVGHAPELVAALWTELQDVVRRATRLLDRADLIAARMEHKLDQLDALAAQSESLVRDGQGIADTVSGLASAARGAPDLAQSQLVRLRALLDQYQPVLESLAPLGEEAATALRPAHLRGLVRLLNELPQLVDRIEPALEGMGGMVPEMREVTDRLDNVGQVVEGLPGAKLLRRRGQAREEKGDV